MSNSKKFSPEEVKMRDDESYWAAFPRILNNFFARFVIGNKPYRCVGDPRGYRSMEADYWNEVRRYNGEGIYGDGDEYGHLHTDKYRNQTPRQFYGEIDDLIVQHGLTVEKVAEIINDAYFGSKIKYSSTWRGSLHRRLEKWFPFYRDWVEKRREAKWKLMFETLLPIYIELRQRGYSTYDLRA